jgi:N-acetylglutamate synthase-like GNAT family acetyltransferase
MTFTRLIDPKQKVQNCLVAEHNGNLIGLVHFIYHAHNWKIEDVCYLQDLFVDPKARCQGVGSALIKKVYAAADLNGTPSVYWMTQDFNVDARVLYDQIGNLTPFIKYSR